MRALLLKILLLTVTALAAGFSLGVSTGVSGLMENSFNAVQVIRERSLIRLVPPGRITGRDQQDILRRWTMAEIRARLAVVLILWAAGVCILVWQYLRLRGKAAPADHPGAGAAPG
jgi:hypothetical protein